MTFMACETPSTGAAAAMADRFAALVPVIETERLRLRAPRVADFPAYADISASPRGQWLSTDQSRDEAWYDFANMAAGWLLRGYGLWSVETRADRALVGFVVLGFEPGDAEPELGFLLTDAGQGKGYAHEAATAARVFAFDTLSLPTLVSYISPPNTRSAALAERLGARRDGTLSYQGDTSIVFRHPKPEDA